MTRSPAPVRSVGFAQYDNGGLPPGTARVHPPSLGRLHRFLRLSPLSAATALVAVALTPEVKFRLREAAVTFGGSADLQILVELVVFGAVGAWIGVIWLQGMAEHRYRLSALGPTMKAVVAVDVVVLASAVTSLSIRSGVRAVQFTVLVLLGLVVAWESRCDLAFLGALWVRVRRGIIGAALLAVVTSAATGSVGAVDVTGWRYSWFAIHPIPTAGILGLAIIMIASMYLGMPDPSLHRSLPKALLLVVGVGLASLLAIAKSRAALIGTMAALLALLFLSKRQQARKKFALAVTASVILTVILVLQGPLQEQLTSVVTRGQTVEQIASLSQRTDLMKIGFDLFQERPLFGHGYLMAGPIFSTYFDWAGEAHNLLVEIGVSMGTVGFIVFGWLLVVLGRRVVSALADRRNPLAALPVEATVILILILAQAVVTDSFAGAVGYEASALVWVAMIADSMAGRRQHPPTLTAS